MPLKILLEGRSGVGKTTLARRAVADLRRAGVPLAGFTSEEIRRDGRRIGFRLETIGGEAGTLAHEELPGPPRLGRYGLDLATLERLALPALAAPEGTVVVVDELGRMEVASAAFRSAVTDLFASPRTVVATVHAHAHPFTDVLKARRDVEVVRVTESNRDALPGEIAARVAASLARGG